MDYIGLLTKIIKESKLTHAEITRLCEEYGVPFNENYISTIKNRASIPSDDISRAIARACGRHEDLLVTQAYYDKSPQVFKDMFDSIIKIVKLTILAAFKVKLDDKAMILARQKFDEMAVGEWLEHDISDTVARVDAIYANLTSFDSVKELETALVANDEYEDICSYIMPDDSMSPMIPAGAQVDTKMVTLDSLKDGDLICYSDADSDEFRIRQVEFLPNGKEKMLLMPVNTKDYKKEVIEPSNNRFYEKIVQVVVDFD